MPKFAHFRLESVGHYNLMNNYCIRFLESISGTIQNRALIDKILLRFGTRESTSDLFLFSSKHII